MSNEQTIRDAAAQMLAAASALAGRSSFRISGGTITTVPSGIQDSGGDVAHDAVDSGKPLKIGGKSTDALPSALVDSGDRVDTWHDRWGRVVVSDYDVELSNNVGSTSLRDRLHAQRYTVLADSVADGLASFWTQTQLNSAPAVSVTGGEGLITTGTGANGTSFMTSSAVAYFPGQVSWLNSAVRFRDPTLNATNVQRVGAFSVNASGVPQDGYYYELNGTTFSVNAVKAGVVTQVVQSSWSRNSVAPTFTLGTSFTQCEIRWTANTAWFYINNVLRHSITGGAAPSTTTLNFRMTLENINSGGLTTDYTFGIRNIGIGRFGDPALFLSSGGPQTYTPFPNYQASPTSYINTVAGVISNAQQQIKSSAGAIYNYTAYNPNAAVAYIQVFYRATAAVTLGTTVPNRVIPLPALGGVDTGLTVPFGGTGSGLTIAITTTQLGSTAPAAACTFSCEYS